MASAAGAGMWGGAWGSAARQLGQAALILGQVAGTSFLIEDYVGFMTCAVGESMKPTFRAEGSIVFVSSWAQHRREIEVGDIVIAKSPTVPGQMVCKRVCGKGGDVVHTKSRFGTQLIRVPDHYVWLLGDNRDRSLDSRSYGPLPRGMIKGKVVFQAWPINERWGFVGSAGSWREEQARKEKQKEEERKKKREALMSKLANHFVAEESRDALDEPLPPAAAVPDVDQRLAAIDRRLHRTATDVHLRHHETLDEADDDDFPGGGKDDGAGEGESWSEGGHRL
eukprot:CAMPEP_0118876170 /NCGR_PEP_ID=MMETSP1163-20130328/16973_1 /TAXON_ID=124430 /ORGANISM="Phaeomonas parva, Strain CCMP2877" /LENGTH=280 /DNA_ID=CAMNT_0006811763 /DNA_START=209 /DNA_END=1051 /DNA_ORIENTATION=+